MPTDNQIKIIVEQDGTGIAGFQHVFPRNGLRESLLSAGLGIEGSDLVPGVSGNLFVLRLKPRAVDILRNNDLTALNIQLANNETASSLPAPALDGSGSFIGAGGAIGNPRLLQRLFRC